MAGATDGLSYLQALEARDLGRFQMEREHSIIAQDIELEAMEQSAHNYC